MHPAVDPRSIAVSETVRTNTAATMPTTNLAARNERVSQP